MIEIYFNAVNVEMPAINFKIIREWVSAVAENHGRMVGHITYIFTDDEEILNVNRQFLNHDYYTDIITFDYSRRKLISGDLYISLDTVKSNSELVNASYTDELNRVIIHGVLHLCGINDKGPGEREVMELHENEALLMLKRISHGS